MRMLPRYLLTWALALTAACGGTAPTPRAPQASATAPTPSATTAPSDVALRPDVVHGTLANGLRYYVLPHQKPKGRSAVWLAVNAGSALEADAERGIAHFIEHLAFNGTTHFPHNDIIKFIEASGMSFGADANAYTSFDETVYQLTVPTDKPELMRTALAILRDWAGELSFDPAEVAKERGVVVEEGRRQEGLGKRLRDQLMQQHFAGQRYADRLPIGLPEVIKNVSIETLRAFYRAWYRPDLMSVIVVGDIGDAKPMAAAIEQTFADLKQPTGAPPRLPVAMPAARAPRTTIVRDAEQTSTSIELSQVAPPRPLRSVADFQAVTLEGLVFQMVAMRFAELRKAKDSPLMGARISRGGMGRDISARVATVAPKAGRAQAALQLLVQELARLAAHGFTEEELTTARMAQLASINNSAANAETANAAEYASELVRHVFTGELMPGRAHEAELLRSFLPTVTLAMVNDVVKPWTELYQADLVMVTSDKEPLPNASEVRTLLAQAAATPPGPWQGKAAAGALMAELPAPGAITKTTALDPALDGTVWQLDNGARVIFKPTAFDQDRILIQGYSPGGYTAVPTKQLRALNSTATIAMLGGLGTHDRVALSKLLAGKQAMVNPSIDETSEHLAATSNRASLETAMQLLYLTMTAPRADREEFERWRTDAKVQLAESQKTPLAKFSHKVHQHWVQNHPRAFRWQPEDYDKLDYDAILKFYRTRFGNAADFTFVIVGSVDEATLRPLVERYLGGLPTLARKRPAAPTRERIFDDKIRHPRDSVMERAAVHSGDKTSIELRYHVPATWSLEARHDLHALQAALSTRLREVLREDKGGTYGVSVHANINHFGYTQALVTIAFDCDPAQADALITATEGVLVELRTKPVSETLVQNIKANLQRSFEEARGQNGAWLNWLMQAEIHGVNATALMDVNAAQARVTAGNILATAKQYLPRRERFLVVASPAAKP